MSNRQKNIMLCFNIVALIGILLAVRLRPKCSNHYLLNAVFAVLVLWVYARC